MGTVSFHFHGYQPGDIVRWVEPDPLKAPRFEERISPVSHRIGAAKVNGQNWTDGVLHAYGQIEGVLGDVAGAASVDIEPQTLAWLLAKDPDAYQKAMTAYEKGVVDLVLTPPFHAILPHHHRLEREILFELMIDFYAPVLRRVHGRPIGLWLPEAAYSSETLESYAFAARRAMGNLDGLPDLARAVHLLLDSRQITNGSHGTAWHRGPSGMPIIARDPIASGEFAFGASRPKDFVGGVNPRVGDSLLVAADLESLLANAGQADRFEAIVAAFRSAGHHVTGPAPPSKLTAAQLVEFSSWSDYDEHLVRGHTSDTRWAGLRRFDGHVVGRLHRGRRLSQLWKHAFTLATERVETAVRRAARDLLPGKDDDRKREALRRLAVAYARHLWRDHYRAWSFSSSELDFAAAVPTVARTLDVEVAAHLARGYLMMLMGLRSDPRFWDNPDTRVTFQNVVCLTQALVDIGEAFARAHRGGQGERVLRLIRGALVDFSDAFEQQSFGGLHGAEGWETTEVAWLESLQSEVPDRSGYNVVWRASLYALNDDERTTLVGSRVAPGEVVADTGHIVGEGHGEWQNRGWCEHLAGS